MKEIIHCPFCEIEFEGIEWESGKCPNCGEEYSWDGQYLDDYSDCWSTVCWNKLEG